MRDDRNAAHLYQHCLGTMSTFGSVQFNWPKLLQAFSVKFTLICSHERVHSIIPHQHMYTVCILDRLPVLRTPPEQNNMNFRKGKH